MGFSTKPSGLPERFPAVAEVTKQTTNDITKTNLRLMVDYSVFGFLLFDAAKVSRKTESDITPRFIKF